jgi:hypothetical protein
MGSPSSLTISLEAFAHLFLGDSNLANFRQIFIEIHSRRPAMAQEFDSTISETEKVSSPLFVVLSSLTPR